MKTYELRREIVEVDDSNWSLGLKEDEYTIYTIQDTGERADIFAKPEYLGQFMLSQSTDVVKHQRSVFTYLDLLGDIGGL